MKKFNIPNFPNYELIDFGTSEIVVNKKTGKVLTAIKNNKDYWKVRVRANKKTFNYIIQVLKWECHNGYEKDLHGHNSKLTIDHGDRNKNNNHIDNLTIMSRADNTKKRYL